jgi:hypothetical protein
LNLAPSRKAAEEEAVAGAPTLLGASQSLELFNTNVDLAKDLAEQRASKIPPRVMRNRCRASVRMPVEDVTSLLANGRKPEMKRHPLHGLRVNDG